MKRRAKPVLRRGTVLVMIVGLLAMLFMLVSAYITLARFDRQTLIQVTHGQQVEQISAAITDVITKTIVDQSVAGGGQPTIPGGRGSEWLAALEPVRIATATAGTAPHDYAYPGVTSVGSGASGAKKLTDLMFDAVQGDTIAVDINPYSPDVQTQVNVRRPFMDADGDGVADSWFGGSALLTELANAMVGRAALARTVDASGSPALIDPSKLDASASQGTWEYTNFAAWQQFDAQARYEVAARVVSHGGMVLVAAPRDPGGQPQNTWNRQFLYNMFNWAKSPRDTSTLTVSDSSYETLWDLFSGSSGAVEPLLRARGGLLVSARTTQTQSGNPPATLPLALRYVQGQNVFQNTFNPYYQQRLIDDNTQRFNLASTQVQAGGEWDAWRQAATLDPDLMNAQSIGGKDPRLSYNPRHLLTTVNNSDDLARLSARHPTSADPELKLREGQLKFYLGRIAPNCYQNAIFQPTTGVPIVRELAQYFYEMMASYGADPEGIWTNAEVTTGFKTAVTRREQAFMLAVNTVTFAAPRAATGRIDPACYQDGGKLYVGYAPQPFITQVMAYKKEKASTPGTYTTALAIELYNPNEPGPATASQGLYLPQFALTLDDETAGSQHRLDGDGVKNLAANFSDFRFPGRRFIKISINDSGGNKYFEEHPAGQSNPMYIESMAVPDVSGGTIKVKLWLEALGGVSGSTWVLVDELEVDNPPTPPSNGDSWVNVWRDTGTETYWGPNGTSNPARWRCVTAIPKEYPVGTTEPNYNSSTHSSGQPTTAALEELADPRPTNSQQAPTTPLPTMNADAGLVSVNNATRPASFPTVGFMLFVPRFSHLHDSGSSPQRRFPMGTLLYREWVDESHTLYRADFGHMPVFDNRQSAGGDFADTADGRVPWGQLVFDYFTTVNPNGPDGAKGTADDIDPWCIPGRININTAPWYVLAGLPVIGPDPSTLNLPLTASASTAFWLGDAGMLTGIGGDTVRFSNWPTVELTGATYQYHVGYALAQSIAAYRDRVPYTDSQDWMAFNDAYKRSGEHRSVAAGQTGYGPTDDNYSSGIRGGGANGSGYRGFLSIGELANVVGFDSALSTESPLAYNRGDFIKAVSLLALIDTHFLTTRSNTYTIYTTLTDRENPQASLRSQVTIDTSKLLPHLYWQDDGNGVQDPEPTDHYTTIRDTGEPEIIGERSSAYFNARYDD